MCLAIHKPSGVPFNDFIKTAIHNAYNNNKDGIGFALKRQGYGIIVRKAVVEPEQCIKWITDLNPREDEEMLIHLRMGTSGEVIDKNCHPFVLTRNVQECVSSSITTKHAVLIHNQVFSSRIYRETHPEFSDTFHVANQIFADPYICGLMQTNPELFKLLMNKELLGTNKVAIMMIHKPTIRLGEWNEDQGVFFSNYQYLNTNNCSIKRTYNLNKKGSEDFDLLDENKWRERFGKGDDSLTNPYHRNKPKLSKNEIRGLIKLAEQNKKLGKIDISSLKPNTILEVNAKTGIICKPIMLNEVATTMLRSHDFVKLLHQYVDKDITYWKCEILNQSRVNFSIEPIRIPLNFKYPNDLNGDSVKDKSLVLLSKGFEKGYNNSPVKYIVDKEIDGTDDERTKIFNPENWSRSKYKNFKLYYTSAKGNKKDKVILKSDGNKYGPYTIEFVKELLDEYEEKHFKSVV
jgi:hypothetical protein